VVTLKAPEFAIDADAVQAVVAASPKVKMLVLNSPHNPTGHVASRSELEAIGAVLSVKGGHACCARG
jgi:N-succinyldiaminopimelate aminotransferase